MLQLNGASRTTRRHTATPGASSTKGNATRGTHHSREKYTVLTQRLSRRLRKKIPGMPLLLLGGKHQQPSNELHRQPIPGRLPPTHAGLPSKPLPCWWIAEHPGFTLKTNFTRIRRKQCLNCKPLERSHKILTAGRHTCSNRNSHGYGFRESS